MEEPRREGADAPVSPEVYRLLVEETRELLCLHETDGRFSFVSPSVRPLPGHSPEPLLGTSPLDLIHPDDRALGEDSLKPVLEGNEAPVLRARFRRPEGTYRWLEIQTRALRDKTGAITRRVTSSRDISDRVSLLAEVSEREATLRSVIASFDDLVFVFDREGRFREYHQPAVGKHLFAPPEAFLGRHYSEVLPEHVTTALATGFVRAREDGTIQEFEYQSLMAGTIRYFHAKLTPMLHEGVQPRGFVGVVRDVTHRHAAEEARLDLVRATERADRLEGLAAFARGTAHEFNNLLTAIQGNLAMAEDALGEDHRSVPEITEAKEAAERAAAVVRRLRRRAPGTARTPGSGGVRPPAGGGAPGGPPGLHAAEGGDRSCGPSRGSGPYPPGIELPPAVSERAGSSSRR